MRDEIIEGENFKSINFSENPLIKANYEDCTFTNCDLSDCDLSYLVFSECTFEGCDLSNCKLNTTSFKDVKFQNCKMLGLQFSDCKDFLLSFEFDGCQLDYASFYNLNIPKTNFLNCQLKEVDFIEANLFSSRFPGCDLNGALFENTNLEKADLRGATSYHINPDWNKLKKAQFSMPDVVGLLSHLDIKIS